MTPCRTLELRPEEWLILYCARTHLDPEVAERILELCQKEIDWTYLLQLGQQHGLLPLLYQNLNDTCAELVPEAILIYLRSRFYANSGSSLHRTRELLKLLKLLAAQDIPAIPFKGPTLAVAVYEDLALRPFGDLDILVRKQDYARAKDLFVTHGHQVFRELPWECHFVGANGLELDLHHAITSEEIPFPLTFEHLWKRLSAVSLSSTTVACPSLEDLLVILSVHLVKDCWNVHVGIKNHKRVKLVKICDIAELLRVHKEMDWEQLLAYARSLRSERALLFGVFLAYILLNARLPEEIQRKAERNPLRQSFSGQETDWLFGKLDRPFTEKEHIQFQLNVRERLQDRVRLMLKPTDQDEKLLRLPPLLKPLYYLVRPIRLLRQHGLKAGRS